MKQDLTALTLRGIVLVLAAFGLLTVLATAQSLPVFGVICYSLIFIFAAAVAIFNP